MDKELGKKKTSSTSSPPSKPSILEHELVPKHEVLSGEEVEEVLKKYEVSPPQLPQILSTDPVVKELGAKPGDIIRIVRKSPTAGETVYYRVVVRAG